jgi:hypothetical protein
MQSRNLRRTPMGSSSGAAICVLATLSLLVLAVGCGQQEEDTATDAEVSFILLNPEHTERLSPPAARAFLSASMRSRAYWHGIPDLPRADRPLPWAGFVAAGRAGVYYCHGGAFYLDVGEQQWRWSPPFMKRMVRLQDSEEYEAERDPKRLTAMLLKCFEGDEASGSSGDATDSRSEQ